MHADGFRPGDKSTPVVPELHTDTVHRPAGSVTVTVTTVVVISVTVIVTVDKPGSDCHR